LGVLVPQHGGFLLSFGDELFFLTEVPVAAILIFFRLGVVVVPLQDGDFLLSFTAEHWFSSEKPEK